MRPWMLAVIGASLDLVVALALVAAGLKWFGVFMLVVAVAGYALALVIRRR
jgi:hypothetical protein